MRGIIDPQTRTGDRDTPLHGRGPGQVCSIQCIPDEAKNLKNLEEALCVSPSREEGNPPRRIFCLSKSQSQQPPLEQYYDVKYLRQHYYDQPGRETCPP